MKTYLPLVLIFFFSLSQNVGFGQDNTSSIDTPLVQKHKSKPGKKVVPVQKFIVDLGSNQSSFSYTVNPNQPIELTIINLLPNTNSKGLYSINQSSTLNLLSPLTNPTGQVNGPNDTTITSQYCKTAKTALDNSQSEADFGKNTRSAFTSCNPVYQTYYTASTIIQNYNSLSNSILTVTIKNTITNNTWTVVFQPEVDGQFVTVYGFTYIPYAFSTQRTFFAQANGGTTTTYTITPASSESIADYAPTVSFHYISKNSGVLSSSFTAGLGAAFNTSNSSGISPVALVGYSVLYHQTIGINLGLAADLVNNLKGQYQSGQVITTNLQSSDLNEKVIGFNPFISIIFRFGSSPFNSKPLNTTQPIAQPATQPQPSGTQNPTQPTGVQPSGAQPTPPNPTPPKPPQGNQNPR
jgi:hypothetical protein